LSEYFEMSDWFICRLIKWIPEEEWGATLHIGDLVSVVKKITQHLQNGFIIILNS
jgi:hypothetical protein